MNDLGGGYMNDFYGREFWRFVSVQQKVGELAKTAIEFPPMQAPASFNLEYRENHCVEPRDDRCTVDFMV